MRDLIKSILEEYTRWTPELVADVAKKYQTKTEFATKDKGAYKWAREKGILDDITKHMRVLRQTWTKEMVQDEALKYNTRGDFAKNSSKAYDMAKKYGWLEDVTKHMRQVLIYWTKEMAQEEALKYTTRKDFHQGSPKAYDAAREHKWLDDICSHMEYVGNMFTRMVYAFEFPDNSVYVGLTLNKKQREQQHKSLDEKSNSAVQKKIKESGLTPKMVEISDGYLPSSEAQKLEECTIDNYKNNGWQILNLKKAGGLGYCDRVWTYETIKQKALEYKTRTEWARGNSRSYSIALSNGWVDDMTKHMKSFNYNRWTKEEIEKIAKKYNRKIDFQKNDYGAYQWAAKHGILDYVTKHMPNRKIWNPDEIYQLSKKYKNRAQFQKNDRSAYNQAKKLGLIDLIYPK